MNYNYTLQPPHSPMAAATPGVVRNEREHSEHLVQQLMRCEEDDVMELMLSSSASSSDDEIEIETVQYRSKLSSVSSSITATSACSSSSLSNTVEDVPMNSPDEMAVEAKVKKFIKKPYLHKKSIISTSTPNIRFIPQKLISDNVLKGLCVCVNCNEVPSTPILQCRWGHILCRHCFADLFVCPKTDCLEPINAEYRNLLIEKIASAYSFPCRYKLNGCNAILPFSEKRTHEDCCNAKDCLCPSVGCQWEGPYQALMTHLGVSHDRSIVTLEGDDIIFLATNVSRNLHQRGTVDWVMVQQCFGHNFILVLERREMEHVKPRRAEYYIVCQMVGSSEDAGKYYYRVELCNYLKRDGGYSDNYVKHATKRRVMFESVVSPYTKGIKTAIELRDCLCITDHMFKDFIRKDTVPMFVTITQMQGSRDAVEE